MTAPFNSPVFDQPRPTGIRRRWPAVPLLLAALVALAAAYSCSGLQDHIGRENPPDIVVSPCTTSRPQITIPVLDVSGSVIAANGADPSGRSFNEARDLARALSEAPCTRDDRFGAVIFADQAVELPPTLITSQSIIEKTLVRPPRQEIGGGTDITRAIDLVDQVAQRYPQADVTAVVLSDMQADSHDALRARLETTTVDHIHLVALGDYDPRHNSSFDTVTDLASVERGDVASALVDAINASRAATSS